MIILKEKEIKGRDARSKRLILEDEKLYRIDDNIYYEVNTDNIEGKIVDIACGMEHFILLTDLGFVYSCGCNKYGQLGLGRNGDRIGFTKVPINEEIIKIAVGSNHSVLLSKEGNAYSFGENYEGQLGLGDMGHRDIPTLVSIKDVKYIACGDYTTIFLSDDLYISGVIDYEKYNEEGYCTSKPKKLVLEEYDGVIVGVKNLNNKILVMTDSSLYLSSRLNEEIILLDEIDTKTLEDL